MSGQIISPMFFYWLQIVDSIRVVFITVAIFAGVFSGICFITAVVDSDDFDEFKKYEKKYSIVRSATVALILLLGGCAVPSSSTLTKMEVAKNITYENISIAKDTIENIADHIIDKWKGED